MKSIDKYYAAFKAGYLGTNVLDTYFSFVANIILENKYTTIEDTSIRNAIMERYDIELPLTFIRQVLAVGVEHNCFVENRGKYSVSLKELDQYKFNRNDFDQLWNNLIEKFEDYCKDLEINYSSFELDDFVLRILDETDEMIISSEIVDRTCDSVPMKYSWFSFVKKQAEDQTDLYSFIAAISASNITTQALFYDGDTRPDYSDLHVYLDSPIIFALLGMDEISKVSSYRALINDMVKAKCNIHVFDHNFQEVDGIIARAASWANSTEYDLRKANNAARFFHDNRMSEEEIAEFCEKTEEILNDIGITVKVTNYDKFQNQFQEDEEELFGMIEERYLKQGLSLSQEKSESIQVDVRSIVIVYRNRQGQTATKLENAKHIMLTSNNAIANVSKKYESNRSIQSGHIPACISADLFGAILWLNSPLKMQEYKKQRLLADCYAFLRPDKKLLDKYIHSLDEARRMDKIDEKKFLFLRTHKVVLDSLMNITKGDYARFNSNTYLEVYDDIQSKAQKQYMDEAVAHEQTRQELEKEKERASKEKEEDNETIKSLKLEIQSNKEREQRILEKRTKFWGNILTFFVAVIPHLALIIIIELAKTQFNDISLKSAYGIAGSVIATVLAGVIFSKAKEKCFHVVGRMLKKNNNK